MEENITNILTGRHVPVGLDISDYAEESNFIPIVKRNVCYICCAVLFDENDRVLLVQEAKQSCYGQWYLPAGRLERGETLVDGTKREVKEESGLECELTSLLCVELNGVWMRFTFAGTITGGKLKTLEEKDSESLQAQFFHQEQLPTDIRPTKLKQKGGTAEGGCKLRCKDVLRLIQLGRKYKVEKNYKYLPVIHPHKFVFHRFIIVNSANSGQPMYFLVANKEDKPSLPCTLVSIKRTIAIEALVESILNAALSICPSESSFLLSGVAGVEHRGTGAVEEDGLCITHLVNLNTADGEVPHRAAAPDYAWHPVTDTSLQQRLQAASKTDIVPLL